MHMSSQVARRAAWVILALTFVGTLIAYPSLPAVMATHFGLNGQVNGTMNTFSGAFLLPLIMLLVLLLFVAIPYIDPLRVNIAQFRRQYDMFVAILMLFFAAVQASILSRNLGSSLDPQYVIMPAVGVLIFYVGTMLPKTRRNWFVGIRTPWTISSDHVWQKTHELGGTLFKVLGIIIVLGTFAPTAYMLWIILVPLVVIAIGLVLYSYVIYEQDRKA